MNEPIALIAPCESAWLKKMMVLLATSHPPLPFLWYLSQGEAPQVALKLTELPAKGAIAIDPEQDNAINQIRKVLQHETPSLRSSLPHRLAPPIPAHRATKDPSSTPKPSVIPVLSSGGAGASTVAMALSQLLATRKTTILIDMTLRAHLGLYHDLPAGEHTLDDFHLAMQSVPRAPNPVLIPTRGYDLLATAGQITRWSTLTPTHLNKLLSSLAGKYQCCVVDLEQRFLSTEVAGNLDWEDLGSVPRTLLGGTTVAAMVAGNTLKGIFDAVNLAREITACAKGLEALGVVVVPLAVRRVRQKGTSSSLLDLLHKVLPVHDAPKLEVIELPWIDLEDTHRSVRSFPQPLLRALEPLATLAGTAHYQPRNSEPRPLAEQLNLLAESLNLLNPPGALGDYLAR